MFDLSESHLSEEEKRIVAFATNIIVKKERGSVPEFYHFPREKNWSTEKKYKNIHLQKIVDAIKDAVGFHTLDASFSVDPLSLKQMAQTVHVSLRLHSYIDRDEDWNSVLDSEGNIVQYESFTLPENYGEKGHLDMTHDHGNLNQETLSEIFSEGSFYDAREAAARLCVERFYLFLAYIEITSLDSTDDKEIVAKIKCCSDHIMDFFEEISRERELINKFRPKNSTRTSQLQQDLDVDVESFRELEDIFKCSDAEEGLLGFLPEWLKEAESYLFDFDVTVGVVFDKSLIAQKQHIYQVLQERKLLIYFFSYTGKNNPTDITFLEHLKAEIQFCGRKI